MFVFVHGVPETSALWDGVRAELGDESVALALPGFGCARPEGFGATKDEYAAWLVSELEKFDEPVDLVGHDWGAGFTYRVATTRGELLHSWVADIANVMHPDYVWHDFAQIWQTPGDGEEFFFNQSDASAEQIAPVFESMGVPRDKAVALAGWSDATMASCILDLYRSATPNVDASWRDGWGVTSAPGLVLSPSDDPFGDETRSREVAKTLGAQFKTLPGLGHWWPLQAPDIAARVLAEFVSTLG
jgi:pimeloyl-ACP methyl ester carboxylesterase